MRKMRKRTEKGLTEIYVEPVHVGNVFKVPLMRVETINDIDGLVFDLYVALRRAGGFAEFGDLLLFAADKPWPYGEVGIEDPVLRATRVWSWWWWFRSRHGDPQQWPETRAEKNVNAAALAEVVATLPVLHERLQRVQVEDAPPERVVRRYAVEGAYCYCAPYGTDAEVDHEALVRELLACSATLIEVVVPATAAAYKVLRESPGWVWREVSPTEVSYIREDRTAD